LARREVFQYHGLEIGAGDLPVSNRKYFSPASTDVIQGLAGLLLTLFVWFHMFFESSILLGKDAMYRVTKMFEGEFLFGEPYPGIVAAVAAVILALVMVHAVLALRRFPGNSRQYAAFHRHMGALRHRDTTLWYVQVVTGFCLFFLVSVHLYVVLTQPGNIGPYASSDRVWSQRFWILYALLLVVVHVHAAIGVYRLALKWGFVPAASFPVARARLRVTLWCIIGFFVTLGSASLVTYMKIGYDHAGSVGERYVPAVERPEAGP